MFCPVCSGKGSQFGRPAWALAVAAPARRRSQVGLPGMAPVFPTPNQARSCRGPPVCGTSIAQQAKPKKAGNMDRERAFREGGPQMEHSGAGLGQLAFHSVASRPRITSSVKSPLTHDGRRRVPSRANPARLAVWIIALLSARVSACSRCRPRIANP